MAALSRQLHDSQSEFRLRMAQREASIERNGVPDEV
jgi:hypothetical protein